MFCSRCGVKIRQGAERCSICGYGPEKKQPAVSEEKTGYRELVEVYSTWRNIEASFLKSLMDSSGIESYIHNLYYPSVLPVGSAAVPIRIMVPADNVENKERAQAIIEEYLKEQ